MSSAYPQYALLTVRMHACTVLDAYGEIIFRAWTSATGACLLELQDGIQGLMEASILATTPAMAAAVRRVLNGLHRQKHHPGVDRMLLDLYEPILFRALSAANPEVRRNALNVFVDAFPLRVGLSLNIEKI
jgi:condensin-2 complex subunit G2